MPTSAGPNILGESNLVFNYDTGDTVNSYIGQPTTNLANFNVASALFSTDTPGNLTQSANSSEATYQGRLSRKMSVGAGYWNAYIYNYNTGVSSTVFAVSYKVKLANGAHPNTIIGGGYIYGSAGTFFPAPTFTFLGDGWYLATMLYSGTSMTLNSLTGMNGTGPGVFYIVDYQAEAKSNSTPFAGVAGTRSNTQGLLDISGRANTIDLASVSFTSAAQPIFDGTDDNIALSSTLGNFGTNSWTIGCWWKANGAQSNYTSIISQGFTGGIASGGWAFKVKNASNQNVFSFSYASAFETISDITTSAACNDGNWHNLVVTRENTSCIMYMDGVSVGTFSVGSSFSFGTGATTYIGYTPRDAAYLKGTLSNFYIFNIALPAAEVLNNYNEQKTRF